MTVATPTPRSTGRSITTWYIARLRLSLRAVAVAAAPGFATPAASAAGAPTIDKNKLLWATINICDTAKHPDVIGIHASMPGAGKALERMYMRLEVEYHRPSSKRWERLG